MTYTRRIEVKVEAIQQRWGNPDRYRITYPNGKVIYVSKQELEEGYEQ